MTKFRKNCCKDATFHHFFHNLNDFYHIILFLQLLFFGIICFLAAKLQFFFILSLSFSFTHSLFLRKVRSAAGAATPVYAENAVSAHFSRRTIYARCANCANDSGGTIPLKSGIQLLAAYPALSGIIRHYPSLSVTIRHYPSLSGNRYSKKQYLCTRNLAGTLGDKQNVQAVSHSFSVPPPFILRSISVLLSLYIRSTFVPHSFFLRSTTENKRKKTEKNGEQTNPKRRRSEFTANLLRISGEMRQG